MTDTSRRTPSAVPKDFTGLSRPQGSAYDRGAFELRPRR
ncbi:MAG: choice-of-anchor Q domain-containing protein [Vicinamibacterales bacterium]